MNASNTLFYRLIANRCEIEEFEQQLYSMADIEERLSELDYLNLISIDYRLPSAAYEALKIVNKYVVSSRYHEWYLGSLLTRIIDRTADVHEAIEECYYLYCIGLGFLYDLGLGYGLAIIAPPGGYSASDWYGLTDIEKERLVDGMYPGIVDEARRVLGWIQDGKVVVETDPSCRNGTGLVFIDTRAHPIRRTGPDR